MSENISNSFGEWYSNLQAATQALDGDEMKELLVLVRKMGVYKLQSVGLRQASTAVLQENDRRLEKPARYFLERLQISGHQPPYPQYTALELLSLWENPSQETPQMAKDIFRLISELISHLLEMQELLDHPHRNLLEKRGTAIVEKCRESIFSFAPSSSPSRMMIELSLIPESDKRDELIFLRVVQGSEIIFGAAKVLTARAIESVAYSDALQTAVNLHWVARLLDLLLPLVRLMAPMSVEQWLQFRPLIVEPSAIQSINFHDLSAKLGELKRIINHPRYLEQQQVYLPVCQELLNQAIRTYRTWDKAHRAIASKYGQATSAYKPEGVQWLEERQPPTSTLEETYRIVEG
ncbi:MAG: hypothetical protein MN733_24630 [Nitrososphaera sp.]|nr:hypothetical protein [Nitrososphaera sp.]